MESVALVLEGGGMRGVYTGGVLDLLMEKNLYFPYVVGVSAGACNAASYISGQLGRNRRATVDYASHPRYLGIRNLLREKSMFGMKLIFDEIPNRLVPFDFAAFDRSPQAFVVATTDCATGEAYYLDRSSPHPMLSIIQASSSLPFLAPIMTLDGRPLLDGGVTDPIPVRKAFMDGNRKAVVVLTRDAAYRKGPFKLGWLAKRIYPAYPGLRQALENRYLVYNETLAHIEQLEREGRVFVIRPRSPLSIGRMEKDPKKLGVLYDQGIQDARDVYPKMQAWLEA